MRIFLYSLLSFIALNSQAQIGFPKNTFQNFVAIRGDYLYMSTMEISNQNYRDFLTSLAANRRFDEFNANLPDTLVWRSAMGYNEPFVEYYFGHPAYADYPVVGITQRQAMNYCEWLREQLLNNADKKKLPVLDIQVRLPSREEWIAAARGNLDSSAIYPWSNNANGDKGAMEIYANMKTDGARTGGAGFITAKVKSYAPNSLGLYNMSGNVAEWISEPRRTKGGGWCNVPYYCRIDAPGINDGEGSPTSWIGFRPVLEIVTWSEWTRPMVPSKASQIEKKFKPTTGNILFGETEISNAEFHSFLETADSLQFSAMDSLWLEKDRYLYHLQYSSCQYFANYPVVNISREAANAYCKWLTEIYMKMPDRKFKNVVFRLPLGIEWVSAAHGGLRGNSYPWPGPHTRNSKGAYLANYHPLPSAFVIPNDSIPEKRIILPHDSSISRSVDGAEFTSTVKSYFPSGFGLYNMSGNVAEMTDSAGVTLGGSWESEDDYLRIGYVNFTDTDTFVSYAPVQGSYHYIYEKQEGPAPSIGFRVVMEILEH